MAKIVLAGRADCAHYAKAELLADTLHRSLPNFRVHKISILPDEWKEWLEATCKRNGWKHEESPLIWRELVAQGGKGMLLGGYSDFLEHCQDYYSITSDMPTDVMLSVAAENLETKTNLIVEEQHRLSLIKPLHIWISSALNPACHFLIPNLISAELFPHVSAISLHLLDLGRNEEELQQLRMETEDLALHLLHQVTVHADLEQAFREADVILLLDECWYDGAKDEDEDEEEKKKRTVKAISDSARRIDSHQFVTMATQLENEARAVIANKLKVKTSDVANVLVWGNINGSFYVDLQRAKVFNYDGAIKGPAFFSQPIEKILFERKWLETDFQDLVRCRRAAVASKTCRAAAMSLANGIVTVLKAWNGICGPDEVFSMAVLCTGYYDLPDGIVLSVPVTFKDGKWSVLFDVTVGEKLKERLHLSASELMQEKELGS
ncbi:putative malate dehydrogenase 1B isoform X2 [Acanthopagrus latus]|uniref:putative malate dehydrogenase 1B isoform X2 n=1 Tax=Acanthopagrus latus TaxID=8177 RepID=UPI00187BC91C|nr:putative malate dehydrogenase 1B isoform X2 [Acanthopagrus latus]